MDHATVQTIIEGGILAVNIYIAVKITSIDSKVTDGNNTGKTPPQ